jgi:hypothetical protein
MGLFWTLFFAVVIFFGAVFSETQHQLIVNNDHNEAAAISGNIQIYRNLVTRYLESHPGTTGTVADASLDLPTWFAKINGVSNYVAGGWAYVYYANPRSELVYQLLKDTSNSALVGLNQGGMLFNSLDGVSSITIPAAVPDGAVVYAGA